MIAKLVAGGDFQLQILAAEPTGSPINGIRGLATIPDASVPIGEVTTLDGTFASPAPVTAGQRYALVVTRPGGAQYEVLNAANPCEHQVFFSATQTGPWSDDEPFDLVFQVFVNPPNQFTIGKLKGRKLTLDLSSAGTVEVTDVRAKVGVSGAVAAAKKKRLKRSSATGGPGTIQVTLRLTKSAKRKLRRNGRLKANARITFTPHGGKPNSQTAKRKVKKKSKRKLKKG